MLSRKGYKGSIPAAPLGQGGIILAGVRQEVVSGMESLAYLHSHEDMPRPVFTEQTLGLCGQLLVRYSALCPVRTYPSYHTSMF